LGLQDHTPCEIEGSPEPAAASPEEVAARAAALLRFAEEAYAALVEREPDPIEEAERAAVFGAGEGGSRHGVAVTEESFAGKGVTP
jgi:tagatose-1,6-bisphosphate aldolase non-catalytic subunit AgaZ/GatZ